VRILSMTATFGKLSRQTLNLEPGMNIIEAPNEWGKSTWCAFIMAMLYGIDTRSQNKIGFLADKEHYKPWSGEPMSGRMDILWNGREITLERQNKGRTPLGDVRAYETQTGLSVPELCVSAPGQVLLGVERSVFARAGFLKQSEMPVTADESLRRRLNELVTTADESGASDALAQKLKDLKNRCRFNRKGLLPEQEARLADLENKLTQLGELKAQTASVAQRQQALEAHLRDLQNHKQALEYAEHLGYAQKLAAARINRDTAEELLKQAQGECEGLPTREALDASLAAAQKLRDDRDALHTRAQLQPPMPQMPVPPEPFRGRDPEKVVEEVQLDLRVLTQLENDLKKPVPYVVGGVCLGLGVVLLILGKNWPLWVAAGLGLAAGFGALLAGFGKQKKLKAQIAGLLERYCGIPVDRWISAAEEYAAAQRKYAMALRDYQQALESLNREIQQNAQAIRQLAGGDNLAGFEETCRRQQQKHNLLQERWSAAKQARDVLQALSGAGKTVAPPAYEDSLTCSAGETDRLLAACAAEQQLLQQKLGQCQGQMAALGQEEALLQEKQQAQARIAALELHYRALVRAQETLEQATQELQRRFAPRISQRSQSLFGRLTGQRYQRMTLLQDLSVEVSAEGENNLYGTLWRSDGTVDQLYLALRLSVAEELTPSAPLILDDALVRFDDVRMAETLQILKEEAAKKQVILFTCQNRETEWRNRNENN